MENTKISEYSTKSINKVSYTFTDIEPDNSISVKAPQLVRKTTSDSVIVEQPLQITLTWLEQGLVKNKIFTITMRTPGDDYALIIGLLHSEGVTQQFTDIESITMDTRDVDGEGSQNEWLVEFSNGITPDLASLDRYLMTYSSCGLCGSTSLKALELKTQQNLSFTEHKNLLAANSLLSLSKKMRSEQGVFELTGGVHGAALFDSQINLRHSFEDIGRHNAVDKVIGKYLLAKQSDSKMASITNKSMSNLQPLWILLVSGRISFEIVQKTIMAGISVLVGVGAPSDLAIQAARRFDLTLIGFVSEKGFNVYHGDWRLHNDYVN
jgi:FdhD protein